MSTQETPSLFDAPPPVTVSHAKDFVRWCCSLGGDFRNSPDIANLRYWAQKTEVKFKDGEEAAVLEAARALFLKRIEQLTRKSAESVQSAAN